MVRLSYRFKKLQFWGHSKEMDTVDSDSNTNSTYQRKVYIHKLVHI